jgi:hypothetical protein
MALTVGAIFNKVFADVELYDMGDNVFDVNPENLNIVVTCLENYYKIKIHVIMNTLTKPEEKLVTLIKLLSDAMEKINKLTIEKTYRDKILEFIGEQNVSYGIAINDQVIKQVVDKNIYGVWVYCKKITDLEKIFIQMAPHVNPELVKPYEGIMIDKINTAFRDINERLKKVIADETYVVEDKIVLTSYTELCTIIKSTLDQTLFITNNTIRGSIRQNFVALYEKYYVVIDKVDPTLEQSYLIMNTIQKICDGMDEMNLKCIELKNNYHVVLTRLLLRIINHYSKTFNIVIKANIKHKNTDINNEQIINVFYNMKRPFLDEKINNIMFKKMVDRVVSELTTLFVQNSDDATLTEKMVINFDVMMSELCDTLIGIAKMAEFEHTFVFHAFRKIKLIKNYYSYAGIDEEGIKSEFVAEYGNMELFEQLKLNKAKKRMSLNKLSTMTTEGIIKGINFFKTKKN